MQKQSTSVGYCNEKAAGGWLRAPGGVFAGVSATQWQSWSWQVRHRLRDASRLADLLSRGSGGRLGRVWGSDDMPLAVTPYYLDLADPTDPADPILAQVVPRVAEQAPRHGPGADLDPFREAELEATPGLVHRYPDRVLLVVTNFCSTHCRHCMRKRAWAAGTRHLDAVSIDRAVDHVATHPEIHDVLISGGDPLEAPLGMLDDLLGRLRGIDHLDVIRIGTRVPVTVPMRVGRELLEVMRRHAPLWLNTQFNHPREVTPAAGEACRDLASAGVVVSNQSVLLRGVNDDAATLMELSRRLLRVGVRPYYLHHCDPVAGLDHLRVPLEEGRRLVRSLHGRLSGLGIPRFVVDLPGAGGKVPPDLRFERGGDGETVLFESPISGRVTRVSAGREPPEAPSAGADRASRA